MIMVDAHNPPLGRNVDRRLIQVAAPPLSREPAPAASTRYSLEARPTAPRLRGIDRALMVWMTRLWPGLFGAIVVVKPETVLRWHRAGFKAFWRWKSRTGAGRPKIDRGLRDLLRRMSRENTTWGASRSHGELLMLGLEVAQSTVSKYMVRGGAPLEDVHAEPCAGHCRY